MRADGRFPTGTEVASIDRVPTTAKGEGPTASLLLDLGTSAGMTASGRIFVIYGCMSRSHQQLPASCIKYH